MVMKRLLIRELAVAFLPDFSKRGQTSAIEANGPILCEGDPSDVMLNFRRDAEISAASRTERSVIPTGCEWH